VWHPRQSAENRGFTVDDPAFLDNYRDLVWQPHDGDVLAPLLARLYGVEPEPAEGQCRCPHLSREPVRIRADLLSYNVKRLDWPPPFNLKPEATPRP
jgi:hypothetical protein